ncbi:MAG: transglutaminase-like domain-containing protein [Chloroflexota bacterium]
MNTRSTLAVVPAEGPSTMRVNVGCELTFQSPAPVPIVAQVLPRFDDSHEITREVRSTLPMTDSHEYLDGFGNRCWRSLAPSGSFTMRYDADVTVSRSPDPVVPCATQTSVQDLPDELLTWMLPSRYVLSDVLGSTAWDLFGASPTGWARVQAICDWVHEHIHFRTASTTPATTSLDVYHQRYGVCRDFAHVGITMCRALNIPARYVFGYLPDIDVPVAGPMDFHSWFEAYLDGRWYTFDARHNTPRIGRIPIGRGRDALDVAIVTQYGASSLTNMVVWSDEIPESTADSAIRA